MTGASSRQRLPRRYMRMFHTTLTTDMGDLLLLGDLERLTAIQLPGVHRLPPGTTEAAEPFEAATFQLSEYFAGRRTHFDLPLGAPGGAFDRAVWDRVAAIPYGETANYGQIARDVGHPDSARAVGASNGRNPLPIVIPCHRVVASDGSLTGYAGGLGQKKALLSLEAVAGRTRCSRPGVNPWR
jgi:methylated-DNA-[protein]-cysteine S-methyltransferase